VQISGGEVDYKYDGFALGSQSVPAIVLKRGEDTSQIIEANVTISNSTAGATDTLASILDQCSSADSWQLTISGSVQASTKFMFGVDVSIPIPERKQDMECPDVSQLQTLNGVSAEQREALVASSSGELSAADPAELQALDGATAAELQARAATLASTSR
jgi:hypothetical protein